MQYKLLEANGIEIQNLDGAAFNNYTASGKSGIIPYVLNECQVFSAASNTVNVATGELMIQGFRVKITDPYSYNFTSSASSPIKYHIVAKITVLLNGSVSFEMICRAVTALRQDNIFATESGVYELEIATFTYSGNTVSNLESKADKIFISTNDSYSREEIDNMLGAFISELDTLIGGD